MAGHHPYRDQVVILMPSNLLHGKTGKVVVIASRHALIPRYHDKGSPIPLALGQIGMGDGLGAQKDVLHGGLYPGKIGVVILDMAHHPAHTAAGHQMHGMGNLPGLIHRADVLADLSYVSHLSIHRIPDAQSAEYRPKAPPGLHPSACRCYRYWPWWPRHLPKGIPASGFCTPESSPPEY